MSRTSELQDRFQVFAGRPGRVAFAPGRINLIGEHTDYSAGFVLPASLALGTWTVVALLNTGSTPADREVDGVRLSLPPYATRMLPRP